MLQMDNQTRFTVAVNALPDVAGVDTLFVVVRGAFDLTARPGFCAQQLPPVAADVYWGAAGTSSLKYASDIHIGKPGTDVALVGRAHAPAGRAVPEMLTALTVAGQRKIVKVIGDRTWRGLMGGFTVPEPFLTMPLVYERAFGGRHDGAPGVAPSGALAEERNPVGAGFRGRRAARECVGQRLPNLEDPLRPLKSFGDQPPPTGFGFVAPAWQPRRAHAGTYDQAWRRRRAPFLPDDYDLRFSSAASAGLCWQRFLTGGEPVLLEGVSPEGRLRLSLPLSRPRVEVLVAGCREAPPVRLETVLIEPDERRLSLTWRAALRCDKRLLRVQRISIGEEGTTWPARSS